VISDSVDLDSLDAVDPSTILQSDWNDLSGIIEKSPPEEAEDGEQQETDFSFGEKSEIKSLYATNKSACDCCINWDEEKPYREDVETARKAKAEREKYAIVHKKVAHGGGNGWKTFSIDVNSPAVRKRLSTVFADYPAADIAALDLSFKPPFVPFVHRWDKFLQVQHDEKDDKALSHLKLLQHLLDSELEESFRAMEHLKRTGFVTFSNAILAFVPGETIVYTAGGTISAGILRQIDLRVSPYNDTKYYVLRVDVVDWNGHTTGVKSDTWVLDEYEGNKRLIELDASPLKVHSDPEKIKLRLIQRGRLFEQLRGQHFKTYIGKATYTETTDNLLYGPQKRKATRPVRSSFLSIYPNSVDLIFRFLNESLLMHMHITSSNVCHIRVWHHLHR
jgi:hypothetical protein